MYAVICIAEENGKLSYVRATSKTFDIDAARKYRDTIDKSREPIVVPEEVVDRAIVVNNNRISGV